MPKFIYQDPIVVLAGSTVTTSTAAVTLNIEADDVETTAYGNGGWRNRIAGLKQATVDFDFHSDVAAGAIDSILWTNLGSTVQCKVRPGGTAAIGPSNPEFTFNVLVTQTTPMAGSVGDLATQSVSFPIDGAVARATA